MTELFAIPIAAVSPDEAALRARLSPERLAYIDRLRGTARQQSFAASLLLDEAVRRHFPAVPRPLVLSAQANGKPYLSDSPEVHFSLSHSSDWAICAVSNHPVGADIQRCDTGRRDVAEQTACSLFEPAFPDTRYRLAVCVLEENATPPTLTVLQAL